MPALAHAPHSTAARGNAHPAFPRTPVPVLATATCCTTARNHGGDHSHPRCAWEIAKYRAVSAFQHHCAGKTGPWSKARASGTLIAQECLTKAPRRNSTSTAHIGDRVAFRIADVFLPEPLEVLASLTEDLEANGIITEFSDSGSNVRTYAVVRITPQQVVVIRVEALRVLTRE